MITLTINGLTVEVEPGTLVIEAAKKVGIEIPVFCYHEKMKPVAACRMCLVEIEKMGKLQPACATPVSEGMVVHTESPTAKKAQAGVLEFLLAQHPLDCPICDKGGECPLQDQAFGYGPGATRFSETKRHLHKHWTLGPLVVLDQERCIQCQRCTRFMEEIVGDPVLVLKERGAQTVVDSADGRVFDSLFGGNTIEMCPVGALTSAPYRFRARPWDITQVSTVCPHCPVGCNMTATVRDGNVMRLLSRENREIDDGWLCDRGRFGYGFLKDEARVLTPLVRRDGELRPASWDEALTRVREGLSGNVGALGGGRMSTEALAVFSRFLSEDVETNNVDWRVGGQTTALAPAGQGRIPDIDDAEAFIFLETDPMAQVPVLYLRIRKNVVHGRGAKVLNLGPRASTPLGGTDILYQPGEGAEVIAEALRGGTSYPELTRILASGQKIVILWDGTDSKLADVLRDVVEGRDAETRILVTGGYANSHGAERMGMVPRGDGLDAHGMLQAAARGELDALLVLQTDLVREAVDGRLAEEALKNVGFLAVLGHLLDETSREADVVLPLAAFAESQGTLMNIEGRAQIFEPAAAIPGECRQDWEVAMSLRDLEPNLAKAGQLMAEMLREPPAAPRGQEREAGAVMVLRSAYGKGVVPEPYLEGTVAVPKAVFEMSPRTAGSYGVSEGDEVALEGGCRLGGRVVVTGRMADGVIAVPEIPGANRLGNRITVRALEGSVSA